MVAVWVPRYRLETRCRILTLTPFELHRAYVTGLVTQRIKYYYARDECLEDHHTSLRRVFRSRVSTPCCPLGCDLNSWKLSVGGEEALRSVKS